jgi:hypothetical protein
MNRKTFLIFGLLVLAVSVNTVYFGSIRIKERMTLADEGLISGAGNYTHYYCKPDTPSCGGSGEQEGVACSTSDALAARTITVCPAKTGRYCGWMIGPGCDECQSTMPITCPPCVVLICKGANTKNTWTLLSTPDPRSGLYIQCTGTYNICL